MTPLRGWCAYFMHIYSHYTPSELFSFYGMIVGGVGVGSDVLVGSGVPVGVTGVGERVAVPVGRGVRDGTGVSVAVAVLVGVSDGASTRVGVISASIGYSSFIAEYQSKPLVNANSLKRAPR